MNPRPGRRTIVRAIFLLVTAVVASSATASVDPATIARNIESRALDHEGALFVEQLVLDLEIGHLILHGLLVPAGAVSGRRFEWGFTGEGRLTIRPTDRVESQQIRAFTGRDALDVSFENAVLFVGDPSRIASPPGATAPPSADSAAWSRPSELFGQWNRAVRAVLGADRFLFRAALDDPTFDESLALWAVTEQIGELFYRIDPSEREQISLGRLAWLSPPKSAARKSIASTKTWVSHARRTPDGERVYGAQKLEPVHYTLDVRISPEQRTLEGTARLLVRAVRHAKVATLTLHPTLEVVRITDGSEMSLSGRRSGSYIDVALTAGLEAGEQMELVVSYRGYGFDDTGTKYYRLSSTTHWYPHAGTDDLATYDITLRWPAGLDLLASGRLEDSGEQNQQRWQRRSMQIPCSAVSFEVGHFDIITARHGNRDLTLAFNRIGRGVDEPTRQEVLVVLKSAFTFYVQNFGAYPLDHLTVVTVARDFSQGLLGFMTLSHLVTFRPLDTMQQAFDHASNKTAQERRIETVAHELAHQWWGNKVGWHSYRDQWLSEALANFSAVLFARRLWPNTPVFLARHAQTWKTSLRSPTETGRPVASLGPVVLGTRLLENHDASAYSAVVYDKGSIVFSTLAHRIGERALLGMLRSIADDPSHQVITTSEFVEALERLSGVGLQGFADRFIFDAGVPQVFYSYEIERDGGERWVIRGQVQQVSGADTIYGLERESGCPWRIRRRRPASVEQRNWKLMVPFQAVVAGGNRVESSSWGSLKKGLGGTLTLDQRVTPYEIRLPREPIELWLDQRGEILADFICHTRVPKRTARALARVLASEGQQAEAQALLTRALASRMRRSGLESDGAFEERRRAADASIQLELARIAIANGHEDAARQALKQVDKLVRRPEPAIAFEQAILESRLDLVRDDARGAFSRLSEWLDPRSKRWMTGPTWDVSLAELSTEASLALALAARETGHDDMLEFALREARGRGADVWAFAHQ
ncbi:MAG: hypothetical protein JSV80_15690 [Acidobacteriota bacterium]|nr:MAG: hypothetical protein JSV80_15690 [Acidobacteriota bacterium]